jgi:hypothetical protein
MTKRSEGRAAARASAARASGEGTLSFYAGLVNWYRQMQCAWDRFWFEPRAPHTLSLIRVLTGAMLLYNHVVWSTQLEAFLGAAAWIPAGTSQAMTSDGFVWSILWYFESPAALWVIHLLSLVVFIMLTVGWKTRTVSVVAWAVTITYCHRLQGVLFGFDQVLAMLAMYLMLSRCGDAYSMDVWLANRSSRQPRQGRGADRGVDRGADPCVANNVATRLLQVHLCVIYMFGGLAKVRGETWWDGSAMWNAVANLEYQTLDMTFLGRAPWLLSMLALVVLFWETFYCALVWPRWSRPIVLALAFLVHAGIGLALGMLTFGAAMITLNVCFLEPDFVDRWLATARSRVVKVVGTLRVP